MAQAARTLLGEHERRRGPTAVGLWAMTTLLFLLTLSTIYPLVWLTGSAFKTPKDYKETPLSVLPTETSPVTVASAANRGQGIAAQTTVTSSAELTGDAYRLTFTAPQSLEIFDTTENRMVSSEVAVAGDTDLNFDGLRVALRGQFETGDTFTVEMRRWHSENYAQAWRRVRFLKHSLNSAILMVLTWVLQLGVNALAAYSLSRLSFPGAKWVHWAFLLTLMVPFYAIFIPLYLTVTEFGLTVPLYGWPAVVIPAGFNAFFLVLFKGFFDGLPGDLIDAARIDGASELQTFWRVAMPLARPIVAVITVFSLLGTWNDFLWPYLVIGNADGEPLMVRLYKFQFQEAATEWVLASLAMAMVPPLVLFLLFQRQIAAGFTLSGIKG